MPFYYYYYYIDIIFSCLDFWPHFSWFWQRHRGGSPGGALTPLPSLKKTILLLWQGEILDLEILEHLSLKLLRFLWRKIVIANLFSLFFLCFFVRFNASEIKLNVRLKQQNERSELKLYFALILIPFFVRRIVVSLYKVTNKCSNM